MSRTIVEAAGGVLTRPGNGSNEEFALVHRPRYDDWSFPKGKLLPGEDFEAAAHREVEEETGLRCRLGPHLRDIRYVDNRGRDKVVRYWLMVPIDGQFRPTDEVDELVWLPFARALELLTYDHDRDLLRSVGDR